jgi:hypothetical protein
MHKDSLSMASLRLRTLSSILVIVISSSEGLASYRYYITNRLFRIRTYRPGSYSLDAMGDISECIVRVPSNGRSGGGFTILASTWAITLGANPCVIQTRKKRNSRATHRVFPSAHSTQPSSGPKVSTGIRSSSGKRPSSLKDCFSEVNRNSFSGIEGDGGLMVVHYGRRWL